MKTEAGQVLLWVLIALVVGGLIGYYAHSGGIPSASSTASTTPLTITKADTLRRDMRKLWTDHVVWTRDYIIAAVDNKPDKDAAATRLLHNQEDIGNAVASYYGGDAGSQLTTLLKQHILIAVDVIEDAKVNNLTKLKTDNDKWVANGNQIADFLATANPNWSKADLEAMMQKHLLTTTAEVLARVHKDYGADVTAFDAVYDHILSMSDTISDGIIKQFPQKF